MKYKLHTLKQSIISKENTSLYSIILIGILLFLTWTTAYALIVFQQFSWIEVISVSISFIIILFLFTRYFTDIFQKKIELTLKNIVYAFLLCFLMCLLSSTNLSDITIAKFVHTYPLLETELGLGWDEDTVYHISIIQSILHFGYPSIAQHGPIFNLYHVLSHYVDSLILFIVQVEPYDSYGLLFTFKIWLFISSITIFIYTTIKRIHPLWYLFIFIVIAPIFVGTWRAMSSHGLWFTTILILFSSLKIFRILIESKPRNKDLYFMFIVIILISLGKISSGFMEASLIGLFLLIKYPKDKRIYLLGLGWSIFFIFYIKLFSESYGVNTLAAYDFSKFSIKYFFYNPPWDIMINSSLLILMFLSYFFKNKNTYRLLFSVLISYLILMLIITVKTDLYSVDRLYFYFGFTYILNLITFQFLIHETQNNKIVAGDERFKNVFIVTIMATLLYISSFYLSANLSFSPYRVKNNIKVVNTQAFSYINKKLDNKNQLSIKKILFQKVNNDYFINFNRPLYTFRDSINNILKQNNISKSQALLFIPKEIYNDNISKFAGPAWARGMLMYAVTGVPLVYAIKNNKKKAYNQQDYTRNSLWKKNSLFSFEDICQDNPSKTIIRLFNFENLKFDIHRCK